MEENRLKPMVEGYDPKVFNALYKKTEPLRKKLCSEIDSRRFGLGYEDILSYFDIKFIHVFNKYSHMPENVLLGFLLNSLKTFKCRILRSAYTQKHSQSIISLENAIELEEVLVSDDNNPSDHYYNQMMDFMRDHLGDNAYCLLEVQLNPPHYILERMKTRGMGNTQKIPEDLLLEYFDLGDGEKAIKFIAKLKKEIREAVKYAKYHFSSKVS